MAAPVTVEYIGVTAWVGRTSCSAASRSSRSASICGLCDATSTLMRR